MENGYLFAYGQNYVGALRTFSQLTGSAPLLPRSVFGVWYSDYTPYSSSYIENSVYSGFQDNDVPLNTLSLDTDWKAPNPWDGWEWNPKLFPDPTAVPQVGLLPWDRRDLEHSLEHRRQRPEIARSRARRKDDARVVQLWPGRTVQGMGLELGATGRIQFLAAGYL